MSVSLHIHRTRTIEAEVSESGRGGCLDLIILTEDGDAEMTLYFDNLALAKAYAAAIKSASRKLERVA